MIPALTFVPHSDVESAFTFVIDEICQTADQFEIPTEILEKIDELASYFQKSYKKEKQLVDNSVILCSPQLYGIITTTRRLVSFEQPMQLKAGITTLRRFSRASTPQFIIFLEQIQLDSFNQKFNILKTTSGTTSQTRKKYRELNEKIRMITNSYKNSDIVKICSSSGSFNTLLDFILSAFCCAFNCFSKNHKVFCFIAIVEVLFFGRW